ncbi:MAG: dicarboxylate/amino acid:cation symporter [bacterium]|nr:dicarboxylate/amino acid:cation symporter [bacterium]
MLKKKINLLIILFFILGILGGLFIPKIMLQLSFIGDTYIKLLKLIIIPIVFTNITVSVYKSASNKVKFIIRTIFVFIAMFVVSFLISSCLVFLLTPSINFISVEYTKELASLSLSSFLTNIFPNNIIAIFSDNNMLFSIIFASVCGVTLVKVKKGEKIIELVDIIKEMFTKIFEIIMYLTPLGIMSLIGTTIANYGLDVVGSTLQYILVAFICSFIILLVVMMLPACLLSKITPIKYIKYISKVWLISATTCSSIATLPYTIKTCKEQFKIPPKIIDLVVPLGCTINMCGGAVSFSLLAIFCATNAGININIEMFLTMLGAAIIINMAAPGIPGGGIVIGATYLSILGIPLSFIGVYSGIYKVLDMIYTTLNVTGDITASIILSKSKKLLKETNSLY